MERQRNFISISAVFIMQTNHVLREKILLIWNLTDLSSILPWKQGRGLQRLKQFCKSTSKTTERLKYETFHIYSSMVYNQKCVHKKSSRERYILNIFNRTEPWVFVNHSLQVNMIAEVPQQYFPQNTQERFGSPDGTL